MLDLNNYSSEFDKKKIFHSNGAAQLNQNGALIGSAGGQTFQQRLEKNNAQNRIVGGYHQSAVGAQRGAMRAKQFTPPSDNKQASGRHQTRQAFNAGDDSASRGSSSSVNSRQAFNANSNARPSIGFKEPPSRGYNPYA